MSTKENSWVRVQEMAFTQWMDETVKKRNMTVEDLRTDLEDGLKLIAFFEILCGHSMTDRYDKQPVQRIQKINNLSLALKFLERDMNVRNPGCSAEDIVDADKKGIKLILGLLWVMYRKYRMAAGLGGEGSKKVREEDMLLEWVRTVLTSKGFEEEAESVQSFRTSFNDGRVFLALAKCFDGDNETFDYAEESSKDAAEKLETAFSYAESTMGVSHLLDANEVASDMMDERALALYTSLFYHAFKTKSELDQMQQTVGQSAEELEMQKKGKEELIKMNFELNEQLAAARAEIAELKEKLEQQKDKTKEEKKRNTRARKQIEEKEEELTEMHNQSRVNSSGLIVLRTNLDAHLADLHHWQKYLEGRVSEVEDPIHEIEALTQDLDKASFQEQLNILSTALQEESVKMAKILAERKREREEYDKATKGKKRDKKSKRRHHHHKEEEEEEEEEEEQQEEEEEEEEKEEEKKEEKKEEEEKKEDDKKDEEEEEEDESSSESEEESEKKEEEKEEKEEEKEEDKKDDGKKEHEHRSRSSHRHHGDKDRKKHH